jgi:aspartate beta-hydroxylase
VQANPKYIDALKNLGHMIMEVSVNSTSKVGDEQGKAQAPKVVGEALDSNMLKSASKHLLAALRLAPDDIELRLQLASALNQANRHAEAVKVLLPSKTVRTRDVKDADARRALLASSLVGMERTKRQAESNSWLEKAVKAGVWNSVWQKPGVELLPDLRAQPWWEEGDPGLSCLSETLERNWKIVRDEYKAHVHRNSKVPSEQKRFSASAAYHKGNWRYQSLFREVDGQCGTFDTAHTQAQQCNDVEYPGTCSVLREATACRYASDSPLAFLDARFSVLEPSSHIEPHCGRTNARIVAHLGLSVPFIWKDPTQPAATMRVGCCETRSWQEGKVLLFDDSFYHEVFVDADASGPRAVLLVHVAHPDLKGAVGRSDVGSSDLAAARHL